MKERNPDPYAVLHLGPAATVREVAHAYRALVRTHHPDTRAPGPVPAGPESGARELQDIMDAYAVLRDPVKRAAYDRQRRGSPRPEPVPAPRQPHGPSGAAAHPRPGPALIIGPVRWEDPGKPAPGQQVTGEEVTGERDLFHQLPDREAGRADEPPRPGYRILWWIRR
ncbi:J domain-containing protein [Arthrobacter sp. 2MCAF14]|uniref:J domain-containing protein n=1 Tax=Arthrobacter sp. 2MCAF14 TaxID=3232982 RepID=UPI003F8F9FD0